VAEHHVGHTGAQHIGVVDAVPAGDRRGDQGHRLHAGVGPARGITEADVAGVELLDAEMLGQGGGQDQPGVGHQVRIVELHTERVEAVRRSHLQGAFLIW